MKITLSRRDRGLTLLQGLFVLALFLVLLFGVIYAIAKAIYHIDTHNVGGGGENTNDLRYTGPGLVVAQFQTSASVPTNFTLAENIQFTDDLTAPWQSLTNFVLQPDQVYDWQQLVDKTKPCGFFKITIYGTNQ